MPRAQRREQILEAATRAFARGGFANTGLDAIAAEAGVQRAQGEFKDADDHFKRLEPLLPKELTTADLVEAARTRRLIAETGVSQAEKALSAAKSGVAATKWRASS